MALEALKNQKTINELATEYQVHPNQTCLPACALRAGKRATHRQVGQWKKQLLEGLPSLFANGRAKAAHNDEALQARLYEETCLRATHRQVGRLKVELDFVKKKLPDSVEEKRRLIDPAHPDLSLRRQCQLLGLCRSSFYYHPAGETTENLLLMRQIDRQYTRTPFYGARRMTT